MGERRVFLNLWSAYDAGDKRHAQIIMAELAERHGFKILEGIPQSIADGWEFVIDANGDVPWPSFVREMPPLPSAGAALPTLSDLPDIDSVRFVLSEPPTDPFAWIQEHVFDDMKIQMTTGEDGKVTLREKPESLPEA